VSSALIKWVVGQSLSSVVKLAFPNDLASRLAKIVETWRGTLPDGRPKSPSLPSLPSVQEKRSLVSASSVISCSNSLAAPPNAEIFENFSQSARIMARFFAQIAMELLENFALRLGRCQRPNCAPNPLRIVLWQLEK
jgi:hypothetical protein